MSTDAATLRATRSVASIPRNAEGPVFREPWQAEAFALALSLNARGLFTWKEWATTLGDEIKKAQAAGDPDTAALGKGDDPQWLYTVVFDSRELWGENADPTLKISIEAFEPYLEPA